jgi:hypothetical protein
VHGIDGRLELIGTGLAAAQAAAQDRLTLGDQGPIPSGPVLLAEQRQGAVGPGPRPAPGLGQQQQRQQAGHLRLVGHEHHQDPGQPDRLGAQTWFGWAAHAGVVDEVDDRQHGTEAVSQLVAVGYPVGDVGRLDLALGPHQTARHRLLAHQERPRHLPGRQATEQPQGQRQLRLGGQGRMTAGEDEPKPVVGHGPDLPGLARIVGAGREHRHLVEELPPA